MPMLNRSGHVRLLLSDLDDLGPNHSSSSVILKCKDGTISAPGLILASISPLFRSLGKSHRLDIDDYIILLPDFQVMLNRLW